MPTNKIDLVGQRFDKLVVLEETRKNNKRAWKCLCDCGNERISYTADLLGGRTVSCGCKRQLDITGQKYGRLTAIKSTGKKTPAGIIWECLCDCGKVHYTTPHALRSGSVLSCGCGRSIVVSEANKRRALDLSNQRFGNITVIAPAENRKDRTCWQCLCDCGTNFITTTKNLMDGHTISCGCFKGSKGENKISTILLENNIRFEKEKTYPNLILETQKFARYDFYLPDYNCLIEYDGIQHFKPGKSYYDNPEKFAKTQEYDNIKNQYAIENGITLIRIPYTHYENILLSDLLPDTSSFVINKNSPLS